VYICNLSYSGTQRSGKLWFKASPGNSLRDPMLKKNPSQKSSDGVAQDVGLEFKPVDHTHTHTRTQRSGL
jgi:hypothetical protein